MSCTFDRLGQVESSHQPSPASIARTASLLTSTAGSITNTTQSSLHCSHSSSTDEHCRWVHIIWGHPSDYILRRRTGFTVWFTPGFLSILSCAAPATPRYDESVASLHTSQYFFFQAKSCSFTSARRWYRGSAVHCLPAW